MSFKEQIENHPMVWLLSLLFVGFLSGIGTYEGILRIAKLEVATSHELLELRKNSVELNELIKSKNTNKGLERDKGVYSESSDTLTDEDMGDRDLKGHLEVANKLVASGLIKPITAKGFGFAPEGVTEPRKRALLARRAAKLDAIRNLAESLRVQIISESKARDLVYTSDKVEARLNLIMKNLRVIEEKDKPDGSAEIIIEITY